MNNSVIIHYIFGICIEHGLILHGALGGQEVEIVIRTGGKKWRLEPNTVNCRADPGNQIQDSKLELIKKISSTASNPGMSTFPYPNSTVLTVCLRFGHNKRTSAPGWLLEINNVRRMDVGNAIRRDLKEWAGIKEQEPEQQHDREVFDHDPNTPKITLFIGQRLSTFNAIPVEPATSILGVLAKFGYKIVGTMSLNMRNGTGIPDQAIWTLQS